VNWIRRLTRRNRLEAQLDAELRDHFDRLVTDYRLEGLSEEQARRRARLDFGGDDQIKELCRDARGTRWLEELVQDLRHGYRALRMQPRFTVIAVLTLAMGVGANMAVFNLVDALLLRPLPVPRAAELVTLVRLQGGETSDHFSYPQVRILADRADLFAGLAGIGSATLNVGSPDALEPIGAAWVNGTYFSTLGLTPLAGRLLDTADDQPSAAAAAVISHDLWQRRFAGDPAAVGQDLLIEGVRVPIVGVAPQGFTGATVGERVDITMAIAARPLIEPENDGFLTASARWLRVLGRPARGLSADQLQARLDVAWPEILHQTVPTELSAASRARMLSMTLSVQSGAQGTSNLRAQFRRPVAAAMALVTLVLIMACLNVANLLLARGAARADDIAVRVALGAGRMRIVRQVVSESALLAAAGTALGVLLGVAASTALVTLIAESLTGPEASAVMLDVGLNWRVAIAAVGLVSGATLLCGVPPAWRASRTAPGTLCAGSHRVADSHRRAARSLVVVQVSLSLAVLVSAALFARSLYNLRGLDMGFRTPDVLLVTVDPTRAGLSSTQLQEFNRTLLSDVEHLPGVRAASVAAVTPLEGGGMSVPIRVNGVSTGTEEVYFNVVGPRYFEIMQTALLTGRTFTPADDANAPAVAVVNDAFVRRHLTSNRALGERVSIPGSPREMQIVGVVVDAVYETPRAAPPPTVYVSYQQHRGRPMTLVIHAPASATIAAPALRAAVQPRVPTRPLQIGTFAQQVERSLVRERLMTLLSAVVGALALLLAAVGLYGLMSYAVINRTREIGVRMALGARLATIQRGIVLDALRMVSIGVVIGLPLAWMLSRLVAALMFGVAPGDPATMLTGVIILAIVGAVAACGPARRAARVDPVISLRAQ
jgi:predicted permease